MKGYLGYIVVYFFNGICFNGVLLLNVIVKKFLLYIKLYFVYSVI